MVENVKVAPRAGDTASVNLRFYEGLWSRSRLARPERFNTWPLIARLLPDASSRLEVGPGLRPRLPIAGTHFIDISATVVARLNGRGALALEGEVSELPFEEATFDLVCAFDILEHVEDDRRALAELGRVLKKDGVLILSVPLHAGHWTEFDAMVGHVRRYDPADLAGMLDQCGLTLQKCAPYGMQPNNPSLLRLGNWFLMHQESVALFWYNWFLLPLGILLQKRLVFADRLPDSLGLDGVAEIVMICRKRSA
jgi:SAM-dependent methyltransferase